MKCAECGVNNVIPTVSVDLPEFGPPEVGPMRECEGDYVFGVTMKPTGRTVRVEVPMDMVRKILLERYLDSPGKLRGLLLQLKDYPLGRLPAHAWNA